MSQVLVTGGTGFVGGHCLIELLRQGHSVRTTVRNLEREGEVRALLAAHGVETGGLSFAQADLGRDDGWNEALAGCEYVLHIASPFPPAQPRDEEEIVRPAVDGTLRVLRAAKRAQAQRVVLTSSFAAIGYGHAPQEAAFDETSWSSLEGNIPAYHKSKTLAERAAWDFARKEGLELVVLNPAGIFGPVLGRDLSSSVDIVKSMLEGKMPACPRVYFGVVDVRDVAELHVRAMTHPAARGERFLLSAGGCVSLIQVAQALRSGLGERAAKAPRRELANWFVRLISLFKPEIRGVLPELGVQKHLSSEKAQRVFAWTPRPAEAAITATGESLLKLGVIDLPAGMDYFR